MNIKFFLFLFFIVVAHAMRKNKQGGRNRKSKFLLVKLKEEDENKKTASHSSFLPGKIYQNEFMFLMVSSKTFRITLHWLKFLCNKYSHNV